MAQVRGTFAALYDNVDKVVTGILRDSLNELPAVWKKYFDIKSSDRKFERIQTVTPFGDVPEKPEGNIYAMDLLRPGYSKDFTHVEFGLGFEVTETALEDDQYDQLQRSAEWLAFSARYVEEKYAASVLNNGFTTETTPDGVSLFNTAHVLKGGGTAKNRPSTDADLSSTSLAAALADMQTETKLESGQLVAPIQAFYLVVPPALEFLAERIVHSAGLPGSADNDLNPIKARRRIEIVVNPLISDTDSWFLIAQNKRQHGICSYTRVPISKVPMAVDPYTGNQIIKVRFRRSWGAYIWQGSYGTNGA